MTGATLHTRHPRLRIRYLHWHNPPCWGSFYDRFWQNACYCHAATLAEMWVEVAAWFSSPAFDHARTHIAAIEQRIDARREVST